MKSIMIRLCGLVLSLNSVFANAAGPVITGDSTLNSMAAAKKMTAGVSGYRFYASHVVSNEQYDTMEGRIDPQGLVYQFSINGQEILEPGETLPGIPFPEKGTMQYFGIDLYMADSEGTEIGHGWFHRDNLVAGDPISIMIRLYSDAKILDLPGADGYTIHIDGQYAGSWSSHYQGYVIWVDETRSLDPSHLYQTHDRNGNRFGAGLLNANYDVDNVGQPAYSAVSVRVSGTTYIDRWTDLGEGIFYIDEQVADLGLLASDAKTFVVDATEGARFYASGDFTEMVVYVNRDGTIYEVGRAASMGDQEWVNLMLPFERVIVVIRGTYGAQFRAFASFWGKSGG